MSIAPDVGVLSRRFVKLGWLLFASLLTGAALAQQPTESVSDAAAFQKFLDDVSATAVERGIRA